jgi:poly(3-hydroxybutyrate) depolymerase
MIRVRLGTIVLLLLALVAPSRASEEIVRQTVELQGIERSYYLLAPASAVPLPLLVLLHGSYQDGLFMANHWQDLARRQGFAILAPNSRDTDLGWSLVDDGPDIIRGFIEAAKTKCAIDPRRVYVMGHSGGAVYALTLAMLESEYFAAVAIHAGGWRAANEFNAMGYAKRKIPAMIFIGDKDEFFSLNAVEHTRSELERAGFPVSVTVVKDHDHRYQNVSDQINPQMWKFLSGNTLPGEPVFAAYRVGHP